jgi:hypothetical protein
MAVSEPGSRALISLKGWDDRVSAALAWAGPHVRAAVSSLGEDGVAGWGLLWATAMAVADGWTVERAEGGCVRISRGAEAAWLCPVDAPIAETCDTIRTMVDALTPVFSGRAWALVLRRPIAPGFEPSRLLEPTRQWLARLDQKRWDADYAIYEDREVSVEFRVVEQVPANGAGPFVRVVCPPSEYRLRDVGQRMFAALDQIPQDGAPIVAVLVSDGPWKIGRRSRLEHLYGKLLEACVGERGQASFSFCRAPETWFGDPRAQRLQSVWWLERSGTQSPDMAGWSDDNPWAHPAASPRFKGVRLAVTAVGDLTAEATPASLALLRPKRGPRR